MLKPKTFLIAFHGEDHATAEPLFYVDDAAIVRTVISMLADRVDGGAGIVPPVRLTPDTRVSEAATDA